MPEDRNKPAPSLEPAPSPKTGRAIVARGRTIVGHHPTQTRVSGVLPDGKQISIPAIVHYKPGQEIELPIHEIVEFRRLGYLVDPDTVVPPTADGPTFAQKA